MDQPQTWFNLKQNILVMFQPRLGIKPNRYQGLLSRISVWIGVLVNMVSPHTDHFFKFLEPTKRLWIRKSYPKNLSIKSDFLFIIVITLSFLISLSYRYINQMQCFIKILIRIADYICKIS